MLNIAESAAALDSGAAVAAVHSHTGRTATTAKIRMGNSSTLCNVMLLQSGNGLWSRNQPPQSVPGVCCQLAATTSCPLKGSYKQPLIESGAALLRVNREQHCQDIAEGRLK